MAAAEGPIVGAEEESGDDEPTSTGEGVAVGLTDTGIVLLLPVVTAVGAGVGPVVVPLLAPLVLL